MMFRSAEAGKIEAGFCTLFILELPNWMDQPSINLSDVRFQAAFVN